MITVLFTMKHDKWKVFIPAIFTMMGMHVMSVGFGTIFPLLFSRNTIVYFSIFLFLFFGVMMIYEAYHLEPKSANEKVKELEDDLMEQEDPEAEAVNMELTENTNTLKNVPSSLTKPPSTIDKPDQNLPMEHKENAKSYLCKNPYLQLVVLLFLADWGNRFLC